jgi:dCTP deaminase
MILSDIDILKAIKDREIEINPLNRRNIGPCSIDLTLDSKITIFRGGYIIDPTRHEEPQSYTRTIDTAEEGYIIKPGEFILGMTREKIKIGKGLAATLEGRSSLARIGIIVHAAGLVNPGTGLKKPVPLALEISNRGHTNVLLRPGLKIVQIIFHRLTTPAREGYDERKGSRYIGQEKPTI